jgi:hypothetical protein
MRRTLWAAAAALRRLTQRRRRRPDPPIVSEIPVRVRASLRPRGLVETQGVLRPAWWTGPSVGPGRGDLVTVQPDGDRLVVDTRPGEEPR